MGAPLPIRLTVDIKCIITVRVYGKGYSQWFVIISPHGQPEDTNYSAVTGNRHRWFSMRALMIRESDGRIEKVTTPGKKSKRSQGTASALLSGT
jgi:hypothetical protein